MATGVDAAESNLRNQQGEENPQPGQQQAAQHLQTGERDEFGAIPEEKQGQVPQEQRNGDGAVERDNASHEPASGDNATHEPMIENAGSHNEGTNINHGIVRGGSMRRGHPDRGGFGGYHQPRGGFNYNGDSHIGHGNIQRGGIRGGHSDRSGYCRYHQPQGGLNLGPYAGGRAQQYIDNSGPALRDLLPVENYISERYQNPNYGGFDRMQRVINTLPRQAYISNSQMPRGAQESSYRSGEFSYPTNPRGQFANAMSNIAGNPDTASQGRVGDNIYFSRKMYDQLQMALMVQMGLNGSL